MGGGTALVGRFLIPRSGLLIILRHPATGGVQSAQQRFRLRIALSSLALKFVNIRHRLRGDCSHRRWAVALTSQQKHGQEHGGRGAAACPLRYRKSHALLLWQRLRSVKKVPLAMTCFPLDRVLCSALPVGDA